MSRFIKQLVDRTAAGLGLLVAAPLFVGVTALVRLTMGSPVLFRQPRAGLHGKSFTLVKFRTMREAIGADGKPLPDAERMTRVGQLLRSTSLDELPQLWNVLRGDMSLVGPRPLLLQYLERYSPEQARRHEMLPGITGWAQINGRNAQTWEQRFEYDVWYVDHWSLGLDLRIVGRTVLAVLRRTGVSQAGQATMQEFMGSPSPSDREAAGTPEDAAGVGGDAVGG